jgi:phosphate transport system ATP-binding protein
MTGATKISVRGLRIDFGSAPALDGISLDVAANRILGVIGPAGSGKTVFLRALNRMNDLNPHCRTGGQVLLDGEDIYAPGYDVVALRRRVGVVFALPVPLPMSIFDNVAYGPRLTGMRKGVEMDGIIEESLKAAFLWDEVKDRLHTSGMRLSGGQQQRLCLARVLAMRPEVVLLDEPCSGLDPISTAKIEDALTVLKDRYTIVLVTNNTKQAARVADNTVFMLMGQVIEIGATNQIFTAPKEQKTNDYVSGRFG